MTEQLGTGTLRLVNQTTDGQQTPYLIERLRPDDYAAVVTLQDHVYAALTDQELYLPRSAARIRQVLGSSGFVIGAKTVDGVLMGVRMVFFPHGDPDNMGLVLGFSAPDLAQVVHLEASIIHPDYRGHRLQAEMGPYTVERIRQHAQARYMTATVSYKNVPSLKDKFLLGMTIRAIQYFGPYMRFILASDLTQPHAVDTAHRVDVPLADVQSQLTLLHSAHVGTGISLTPTGAWMVHYQQVVAPSLCAEPLHR